MYLGMTMLVHRIFSIASVTQMVNYLGYGGIHVKSEAREGEKLNLRLECEVGGQHGEVAARRTTPSSRRRCN
jgi:hypothetical protein